MYSRAYQTVGAGGIVREDEAIAFFGQNKVSVGRVTSFTNLSAAKEPVLSVDYLQHEGVGKPNTVSTNISAYNPTKTQVS